MYKCKCCGHEPLPVQPEDAVAYICPICWWENDVFTADDDEPSDENHGLTLNEGRKNYKQYGICDSRLKEPNGRRPDATMTSQVSESDQIIGGSYKHKPFANPKTGESQ